MFDLDYPVTYLYTTLHYYERLLFDKHGLKKMLVYTVLGMGSSGKNLEGGKTFSWLSKNIVYVGKCYNSAHANF